MERSFALVSPPPRKSPAGKRLSSYSRDSSVPASQLGDMGRAPRGTVRDSTCGAAPSRVRSSSFSRVGDRHLRAMIVLAPHTRLPRRPLWHLAIGWEKNCIHLPTRTAPFSQLENSSIVDIAIAVYENLSELSLEFRDVGFNLISLLRLYLRSKLELNSLGRMSDRIQFRSCIWSQFRSKASITLNCSSGPVSLDNSILSYKMEFILDRQIFLLVY